MTADIHGTDHDQFQRVVDITPDAEDARKVTVVWNNALTADEIEGFRQWLRLWRGELPRALSRSK